MIHHAQLGTRCARLSQIVLAGIDPCGVRIVAFSEGGRVVVLEGRPVEDFTPTRAVEAVAVRPVVTITTEVR